MIWTMVLAMACSGFKVRGQKPRQQNMSKKATPPPAWVTTRDVPNGCAIGVSGNTIYWPDSVLYATQYARANLAANISRVNIKNLSADTVNGKLSTTEEAALQTVEAVLRNVVTVALWIDREGVLGQKDFAYAMVCERMVAEQVRKQLPVPRDVPEWIYDPRKDDRLCVWGFSAATIDSVTDPCSQKQRDLAIQNAQEELAKAIGVAHKAAFFFYIGKYLEREVEEFKVAPSEDVTKWAKEEAEKAEVVADWCDKDGRGPLQDKLVYYVLLCIPMPTVSFMTCPMA